VSLCSFALEVIDFVDVAAFTVSRLDFAWGNRAETGSRGMDRADSRHFEPAAFQQIELERGLSWNQYARMREIICNEDARGREAEGAGRITAF